MAMVLSGFVTALFNTHSDDVADHGWSNDDIAKEAVGQVDTLLATLYAQQQGGKNNEL